MTSQPPRPPSGGGFPPTDSSKYTPWFTRVLAYVIDSIPVYLLLAIGFVALITFQKVETLCMSDVCATGNNGPSTTALLIMTACVVIVLVFSLWNVVVRQGNTGSSIGKQMMKFKVVGEQTQQPIGIGKSFIRQIAHSIDAAICYIGFLFPLWDARRQTIADKLMKTVCVPL